jgi:hypothetical protein
MMSRIFPRPNGTAMVIDEDTMRHPIAAAKTENVAKFQKARRNFHSPPIFHFSCFASDNSLLRSVAFSLTFDGFTPSAAFVENELFDFSLVKEFKTLFREITFALF